MPILYFKTLVKIFLIETGTIALKVIGAQKHSIEQRKHSFKKQQPMFKEMRVGTLLGPRW